MNCPSINKNNKKDTHMGSRKVSIPGDKKGQEKVVVMGQVGDFVVPFAAYVLISVVLHDRFELFSNL